MSSTTSNYYYLHEYRSIGVEYEKNCVDLIICNEAFDFKATDETKIYIILMIHEGKMSRATLHQRDIYNFRPISKNEADTYLALYERA